MSHTATVHLSLYVIHFINDLRTLPFSLSVSLRQVEWRADENKGRRGRGTGDRGQAGETGELSLDTYREKMEKAKA